MGFFKYLKSRLILAVAGLTISCLIGVWLIQYTDPFWAILVAVTAGRIFKIFEDALVGTQGDGK